MGRSERQGKARRGGCDTGRGVRRGDSAPCTHQVACTTGNGEMGDVRLVPRTCSTKTGLAPAQPARLFFGPREMLAVAGAGAQSTSVELVLAQAALPDAMLASRATAATPSRHTIASKLGSCGLAVEER